MTCVFCELQRKAVLPLRSNMLWTARLDAHPVSPGHVILIPNRHIRTLDELSGIEWASLDQLRHDVIEFLNKNWRHVEAEYARMRDARLSALSPAFIGTALAHPRFGASPDGYNHGVNEGSAAGQTIEHLHWHIIPRYLGDMADPVGGVRHVLPHRGNYRRPPQ